MLRGASNIIKDFLFPIFCAGCGEEGVWFCEQCKRRTEVHPFVFYPDDPFFDNGVLAFFSYRKDIILDKLIGFWKYGFAGEIIEEWREICIKEIFLLKKYLSGFDNPIFLLPVPLHIRREHERGFNQSQILGEMLQDILSTEKIEVELIRSLRRVRYTRQQAKLDRIARQANLKSAFEWIGSEKIPKQIILVDDIFTTGSTIRECVEVLSSQGVQKIGAIVLAHG